MKELGAGRCRDIRWAAIGVIWALAVWHSWEARALFSDGSQYFVEVVLRQWPIHFYPARDYAMVAAQLPLLFTLLLGVTDLHWLARLLSFGLFALPTVFYHLALVRARDDGVLLAAVIVALACVFATTSFHIHGEYNTAYAVAILAGVMLVADKRPSVLDGVLLVALATFALRVYEVLGFLGLLFAARTAWIVYRGRWLAGSGGFRTALLAVLIVIVVAASLLGRYAILPVVGEVLIGAASWALVDARARPWLANGLYVLAAALFMAGTAVAARSVAFDVEWEKLEGTALESQEFWWNIQFDLAVGIVVAAFVWALARPQDLKSSRFYLVAAAGPLLLALSPLMALIDRELGPLPGPHGDARVVAGSVVLAVILFMWAYRSGIDHLPRALRILRDPLAGRRLALWAFLMLVASVPADIVLTRGNSAFLQAMQSTIRDRSGLIAFEDTPLAVPPLVYWYQDHSMSAQSLALRSRPTDGIVLPLRGYTGPVAVDPLNPPDLGRYFWRE